MSDSHEAECALLGSIILNNQIYAQINTIVIADDFNTVQNRELFVQIDGFLSKDQPVDAVILSAAGNLYAFELIRRQFVAENAVSYAQIVRNASLLRKLSVITSKFNVSAHNTQATPEHIFYELSAELLTLQSRLGTNADWLEGADMLLVQTSESKWLIKGWLPQEALTMIHAKPGVGKSFVALDWALHICCGLPTWFDCVVSPGPVVYLAGEGHFGLRKRLKAWSQYYKQPSLTNMVVSSSACLLDTPEGLLYALEAIRKLKTKPVLIIIDTLHQFSSGNINDWQDATKITDACNKLRLEFGATILLIHHTGHSDLAKMRGMGSQALNAPLDVNINLTKDESGVIAMQQVKMKDHEMADKLLIELKSVEIDGWIDSESNKMQSAVIGLASDQKEANYLGAKMKNAQSLFEEIWLWSNTKLTNDDRPYIFIADMGEYLKNARKMNPEHIRKLLCFTADRSPFAYLLRTNMVEMHGEGCAVLDQEWSKKLLNIPVIK